jgi:hypothetical protein
MASNAPPLSLASAAMAFVLGITSFGDAAA